MCVLLIDSTSAATGDPMIDELIDSTTTVAVGSPMVDVLDDFETVVPVRTYVFFVCAFRVRH